MYAKHPLMTEPADDANLWRYLDFTKFVAMLETGMLYYSQLEKLGDPYEGHLSRAYLESNRKQFGDGPVGIEFPGAKTQYVDIAAGFEAGHAQQRSWVYVSCWHENDCESAAMWKLYAKSGQGVAIQTTFNNFKASISKGEPHVVGGLVDYIDYEEETIDKPFYLNWACAKRRSFEHEREFRSIVFESHEKIAPDGNLPAGIEVPVNMQTLVEEIYIAPTAPAWLEELVKKLVARYELTIPVRYSPLYDRPAYVRDMPTLKKKISEAQAYGKKVSGKAGAESDRQEEMSEPCTKQDGQS